MTHPSLLRWKVGHQVFFLFIQSTLMALMNIERFYHEKNRDSGRKSLRDASCMMEASALAMRFAGDFPKKDYEKIIRPSMPEKFSGLGSMDHAYMVKSLAGLRKNKAAMKEFYGKDYDEFVLSLAKAYDAHIYVCDKFVENKKSLRTTSAEKSATNLLGEFKNKRVQLIKI
ncbi:hypothetical protein RDT67_07020 [Serratia fonticola]|uniref:Uncharacterized protein n=1 Tax=Serratia fonticola TaxID=47917 RepID=A0AAJ2D8K7_SERFO|nr:hypothetical protein [Serratia fonticola]MDQ9126174.1 hypothetical protein [Serratia fonticola]